MLASVDKWLESTTQRINSDLFLMFHLHQLQRLKSNTALRWEAMGTQTDCYNTSTGVNLKFSSCFMLSTALIMSSTKGFLGDVYTVGSSVMAAQCYRLSAISSGTAGSEAAVSGAVWACRASHPGHAVPRLSQPKESSLDMSPCAAISFPKHSAYR